MEINLNAIKFTQDEYNNLKDVILNALNIPNPTNKDVEQFWVRMPDDIKLEFIQHGTSDTPTRENMYEWLQETFEITVEKIEE